MKKIKTLRIIILILVLLNLSFLVFHFFVTKPPHGGPGKVKEMIITDLHFDKQQSKAYEMLIKDHQQSFKELQNMKAKTKRQLYLLLDDKNDSTKRREELIMDLGNVQTEIEELNYAHFHDIYKICKPEQHVYFKKLQNKLALLFDRQGPPPLKK
jgi:hypothetical protein